MSTTLNRLNADIARQHQNLLACHQRLMTIRTMLRPTLVIDGAENCMDGIEDDINGALAKLERAMKVMEEQDNDTSN